MTVSLDEPRGKWVVSASILGSGIGFLDSTVVNVALPTIARDLGGGVAGLQWVVDAYLLTLAGFLLLGGSLGDLFGRRRVFVAGLAGFAVTSLLCGIAPTMPILIGARALQGAAAALLMPTSLALVVGSFSGEQRGRAIGLWTGFAGVWAAVGPFLGGVLVDAWTWRLVFIINPPLAIVAILIALRCVPESKDTTKGRSPDVAGALLAATALGGVVYALIEGPARGFGSTDVVALAVVGVLALAAFVIVEARRDDPMLPLGFFRNRTFLGANLSTLAVYAALSGAFFFVVLQLQVRMDFSPTAAGTALIPVTAMMLVLSPVFGGLAERIGPRIPMTVGPLVAAGGLVLFARLEPGRGWVDAVLPAAALFGLGLAITVAPLTAAALGALEDKHSGIASAVNNAVARAAGLIAVAVLPFASGASGSALEGLTTDAFRRAMFIAAGLAVAGSVAAAALVRGRPERT